MYRGMAHVWQWNGGGQANPGLIDGIANYVRMKANLAPVGRLVSQTHVWWQMVPRWERYGQVLGLL
ncbi:unnamed protein product [Linum tenue]|uniref:Uncharacterized protein n=1 Tax=Linum tenue TaxID=586396 RepID=A0AAV0KPK4_9ROSI|nr:unnamed protein product [Linum tenue]